MKPSDGSPLATIRLRSSVSQTEAWHRAARGLIGLPRLVAFLWIIGPTSIAWAQDSTVVACARIGRVRLPPVAQSERMQELTNDSVAAIIPFLSIIRVQGLEDKVSIPDSQADRLEGELRQRYRTDPERFRWLLLKVMSQSLYRGLQELPAVEATMWYREFFGDAAHPLSLLAHAQSDEALIPLSAINEPLDSLQEQFVVRLACDVGLPIARLRHGDPSVAELARVEHLMWVHRSERILRHAERLVRGPQRAVVQALVQAVSPREPKLDPAWFAKRGQP